MNAMRLLLCVLACMVMVSQPARSRSNTEDPQDLMGKVATGSSDRLEGVHFYAERMHGANIPGLKAAVAEGNPTACFMCRFYQVLSIVAANKHIMNVSSPMSAEETAIAAELDGIDDPELFYDMSAGLLEMQGELSDYSKGMPDPWKGMAEGVFGDTSPSEKQVVDDAKNRSWEGDAEHERESPWLNPFRLFGAGSYMYYQAGEAMSAAKRELAESAQTAKQEADTAQDIWRGARIVGNETVNGEPAEHIEMPANAEYAGESKTSGNAPIAPTFEPVSVGIWIQPETFVILKHRVDGIALANGESRQFFIEAEFSDFRHVPNSSMYQPYKRVMRMGGLMDDAQMAQMEEARKQLAELDRQMESMTPEQRKMMESMVGNQLDTVRGLANGGVFEYVETIDEILVNPDLKALLNPYPSGMTVESAPNLVRQIQAHLVTLGYEPGNTDGLLDTMTKVAISQFQAEHGLAVTGEPSTSLLDALTAQTASQGAG